MPTIHRHGGKIGQPLAVDLTGIEDADGLTNASYSYQWVRGYDCGRHVW